MLMAAVFALPAMAQWSTSNQLSTPTPALEFRSTSTMPYSGSTYSATPQWNADGTATYNAAAEASAAPHRQGPYKAPPINGDEDMPLGDALLPLLMMAIAYTVVRRFRGGVNAEK